MIKDPALIMIIFVLLVFSGIWLQGKVQFVRKLSAAMYCIFVAMILANIGIIPTWSSAHAAISSYVVPFSIAMILFGAKIKDLKLAAPPAIKVFIIHAIGTVIAFGIGALLFKPFIGEDVWQAAGVFISGAIGGTVNTIITGNALGTDPDFFGSVLTAGLVGFTFYLFFIFSAPSWMKKLGFKSDYETLDKEEAEEFYNNYWKEKSINLNGITAIISVAVIITAVSIFLKANFLDIPVEVYVATITLIIANITKIGDISGSEEIGSYGFHLFFASIGGMISITALIKTGPMLLVMYLVSLVILTIIVFFVAKKMKISLEAICIASNAGIGGPTTAPVMAVAFGWKQLVLTGIVLGIFGYAFSSYIGIGAAYLIKFILI